MKGAGSSGQIRFPYCAMKGEVSSGLIRFPNCAMKGEVSRVQSKSPSSVPQLNPQLEYVEVALAATRVHGHWVMRRSDPRAQDPVQLETPLK